VGTQQATEAPVFRRVQQLGVGLLDWATFDSVHFLQATVIRLL